MRIALAVTTSLAFAALPAIMSAAGKTPVDNTEGHTPMALIKALDAKTVVIANEADQVEALTRLDLRSYNTDADHLMRLRDRVNEAGKIFAELVAVRNEATPEEQKTIDRAGVLLKAVASDTQSAIQSLDAGLNSLWRPQYAGYLEKVATDSHQLSKSLGSYLELARVRGKENKIEQVVNAE